MDTQKSLKEKRINQLILFVSHPSPSFPPLLICTPLMAVKNTKTS